MQNFVLSGVHVMHAEGQASGQQVGLANGCLAMMLVNYVLKRNIDIIAGHDMATRNRSNHVNIPVRTLSVFRCRLQPVSSK